MAKVRKKYDLGVKLNPTDSATGSAGELRVSATAPKLKVYMDDAERSVVTEDQTQILTNKTINATAATGTNSLSADAVDIVYDDAANPLYTLGNNLQVAMDAVKTQLDAQNEASEIDFDPTTDITSDNVQGAIEDVQANLQSHLDDTSAHDAANITYTPVEPTDWIIAPTKVDSALNELSSRVESAEGSLETAEGKIDDLVLLSGVSANSEDLGTFTGTTIADNSTVKVALQALETHSEGVATDLSTHEGLTEAHGATGAVVGTTNTQTLQNKTIEAGIYTKMQSESIADNAQTGSDVVLDEPTQPIVRLTSSTLTSISGIAQASYTSAQVVTLINTTVNDIEIKNNLGATVEQRILTGTDDDITLAPDAALFLKYDSTSARWRVIGGTGGASTVVKGTAGENLAANEFSAIDADGNIYKLDASNDDRIEYIGAVKNAANATESVKVISSGIIKGFTGLTPGLPVFADPLTAGGYTQLSPEDSIFNNKWVIRLGIAISATQILLNPDQAGSAYFKDELAASGQTINNNQTVVQPINNLIFDGSQVRGAVLEFTVYRRTDDIEYAQIGQFSIIYKTDEMTWTLGSETFTGDNSGVVFSITSGGQIQYTSSNMSGANYSGTFNYKVDKLFQV